LSDNPLQGPALRYRIDRRLARLKKAATLIMGGIAPNEKYTDGYVVWECGTFGGRPRLLLGREPAPRAKSKGVRN
jgi:hypothetical protein